jgi:peroxiredoxin
MTMRYDPTVLPADLPVPMDDGACAHLPGMAVPAISLQASNGTSVDLAAPHDGRTIVYVYPRTGRPNEALPTGWDSIPGARGCTPESCAFRDLHDDLNALGARVFGLSAQTVADQQEVVTRLHLPFVLLSDAELAFASALRLPTFHVDGMTLIKRLTLVIRGGAIEHVFYSIFPPDAHADEVCRWLSNNRM